jgi:2'-5' RNA ligase
MRLFVAVRPPPDVIDELAALERQRIPGGRWTAPEHWHVTLRFFGEVDDPSPIATALRNADLRATTVSFGPKAKRLGHLLWFPVSGLDQMASEVVEATRSFGKPPERRRFRGHITMLRQRSSATGTDIAWGATLSASWTVRDVELIRSHLGGGPARYETLERFALSGP